MEKLERLKELVVTRVKLDEEIKALKASLTADVLAASNGNRKPRKPRAPKQLSLVK